MRWIVSLLLLIIVAPAALADTVLYDSNGFEGFTTGMTPIGQDPSNPWLAFGGSPGAYTVQSGTSVSGNAIQGNGGGLNDGSYVWPDLGYTPGPNDLIRIQVDIARTLSPTVADSSPVYAVDIYDEVFHRTTRFGLQNNNGQIYAFISVPIDAMGNIDPAGSGIRSQFYGTAIAPSQFVNFDFTMDYQTKTVSMKLDGVTVATNVPFRTPSSTFLDSAELQVGTFNNLSNDNGWFDNYKVSVVAVPEPASMIVLLSGAGIVVAKRYRTRRSDPACA